MKRTGVVIFFWAGKASPLALIVLLAATFDGNKEMVEVLLAGGADINQTSLLTKKGKGRYTPLKLSQLLGHMEIAEILNVMVTDLQRLRTKINYLPKAVKNTGVEGIYHG